MVTENKGPYKLKINTTEKIDKSINNATEDQLAKNLKDVSEKETYLPCPFPQHEAYAELWKSLTPDKQKEMEENIKISADGKIEMIKMKKKFSVLTGEHNGRNIFAGEHVDKNGNTGVKGVTYMTGEAAEEECKKQGKKLLDSGTEVKQFITIFPGENPQEKILNFVKLFGLQKSGFRSADKTRWSDDVGSVGYAKLSEVYASDNVDEAKWNDTDAKIKRNDQMFPSPYVAYEAA